MLIFRRSNCIVTAPGIITIHSVHRLRADSSPLSTGTMNGFLWRVTIPDAVTMQFDLLKLSMVLLETCRELQCNIYYYRINKLWIKLVIETSQVYRKCRLIFSKNSSFLKLTRKKDFLFFSKRNLQSNTCNRNPAMSHVVKVTQVTLCP